MDDQDREKAEYIFSAISMALTEHGKVFPTYIMIVDGQLLPVLVAEKGEMSLAEYEEIVHLAAQQTQPEAMMLICEQWMVAKDQNDPEVQLLIDGVMKASDHEDKKSYLTLIYTNKNGESESLIAEIDSDPAGTRFTRDHSWIKDCVSNMIRPWTQHTFSV